MADHKERDELSGAETTGHEWDGLKELNIPAPRWWLWVFLLTVVWSVGYWIVYPAWPTLTGSTEGTKQWTQHTELKEQQALITEQQKKYLNRFQKASLDQIRKNPELYQFARAGGAAAFKEHCAACHGTGAAGSKGYPNLNDDEWLWGGTLEQIYATLKVGIRSSHPDTLTSLMPAFGRDGLLTSQQISDVADYVLTLTAGDKATHTDATLRGKELFATNCASCHGETGQGSRELGAPALNDAIWLYGNDRATIVETITNARAGVMPTWETRLSDDTLKQLTIYVHSLGGGE